MEGKLQLRKPENWQDFERLCKALWGEIWECSDTIKRNGRQGKSRKVLMFMVLKKENAFIVAYSVKEKMIIRIVN